MLGEIQVGVIVVKERLVILLLDGRGQAGQLATEIEGAIESVAKVESNGAEAHQYQRARGGASAE